MLCHKPAVSLTGVKAGSSKDPPESQPEKEVKPGGGEASPAHPGYGANKKFPYIDE